MPKVAWVLARCSRADQSLKETQPCYCASTKLRPLASGKPQTTNRKPQLRVRSFVLLRFQTLARRSVHFYLAKIQYNTRIHIGIVRLQGSPEETKRLFEAWAPQSKRNKQNKMIFAEWYVKNRNQTETELSYEFSNRIEKKKFTSGLEQNTFHC